MRVNFEPGLHIRDAAILLTNTANEHGEAEGTFNGVTLRAAPGAEPRDIEAEFDREIARRAEEYRNSPEGRSAAEKSNAERAALQAKHDDLMKRLPSLDFKNRLAVMEWLCAMQEPSDRIGVIVRKETICAAFAKHGFLPNANCGGEFRPDDCDNVFRYLVGQALSGLSDGPAIHGVIHKFAADWRDKFHNELCNC